MALRLALVIDGDPSGAKKALDETAAGIEKAGAAAEKAKGKFDWLEPAGKQAEAVAGPVKDIGQGMTDTAAEAPGAAKGIGEFGAAAGGAASNISSLKAGAIGLVTGVAGAFAAAGLAALIDAAFGAFVNWAAEIASSAPRIKRDLQEHESLIKRIKGAYAEAQGAASSYGNESRNLLTFEQQQNISRLGRDFRDSLSEIDTPAAFGVVEKLDRRGAEFKVPFADDVKKFKEDLKDGLADVIAFRTRIAEEAAGLADDSPFRPLAEDILAATEPAAKLQEELQRSIDLYKGLAGDSEAAATALGGSAEKLKLNGEAAAGVLPALREYDELLKSIAGNGGAPPAGSSQPGAPPGVPGGSFASGGFTGDIAADRVAGFVHGREYVFDAASTARIGVGNLDAIRRGIAGYAGGGYVGPSAGSGSAGGRVDIIGDLARDFSYLRGSLSGFARELRRTGDVLGALGGAVERVSDRFLNFALGAVDKMLFGGGAPGSPGGASGFVGGWLESAIGSLFGGGAGGGFDPFQDVFEFHGGGTVGARPATRRAPLSAFIGAPRYHGGGVFKQGEMPAVVMEGEEIGWPNDLARKYGGGTVVNHFHVQTPSPRAFAESQSTVARAGARFTGRLGRYS